jgi:hypothetical protein
MRIEAYTDIRVRDRASNGSNALIIYGLPCAAATVSCGFEDNFQAESAVIYETVSVNYTSGNRAVLAAGTRPQAPLNLPCRAKVNSPGQMTHSFHAHPPCGDYPSSTLA